MRTSNIVICLAAIENIPSGSALRHSRPAFIHHTGPCHSNKSDKLYSTTNDNLDPLFEAEEAAAVDAHDVSDPGIEGAAMERAVIMAAELKDDLRHKIEEDHERKPSSLLGKIKSFFHHDEATYALEASDAEANFAHDLSDTAAMEHANEISIEGEDEQTLDLTNDAFFEAEEAAAVDAHGVSDPGVEGAAMERAVIMAAELKEELQHKKDTSYAMDASDAEANFAHDLSDTAAMEHANEILVADDEKNSYVAFLDAEEEDGQDILDANEAEAKYAHDLSDVAALEHAKTVNVAVHQALRRPKKKEKDRAASVEEHYKSIEKDIHTIEHLIKEADKADRSEGHSLERTFSDDDSADLALMMIEKSVLAATDKLELCQKKAEQTELEVKIALEEKYSAKALAESIERERRAAEMRFLATEHFSDDADVLERKRDSSILHADKELLLDTLKQEHDAELKLEKAVEQDIAAKIELEQMIENKVALKQELHDLESIIHERTVSLWEKEYAKKPTDDKKQHHFDWWHPRW